MGVDMKWLFKTYAGGNPPTFFECEAEGIVEADVLYEQATGLDPECKGKKMKGIMVTRFCPELPCNNP